MSEFVRNPAALLVVLPPASAGDQVSGAGEVTDHGLPDTPARPCLYAAGMAGGMPCGICGPPRFGLVGDAWQGGWFLALAVPEMPA